jgi:hypothetical protein
MNNVQDAHKNARVRVRIGDKEVEIEGAQDFVSSQTRIILQEMGVRTEQINEAYNQLALPISTEVPEVVEGVFAETVFDEQPSSIEQVITKMSLLDFFQEKDPKNQRDQVLVIAYFYLKHLRRTELRLEDYTEAFMLLRRLGIDMPANMKSTVRNVVDRTKFLFNPERGQFALTLPGEKLVESMPLDE